MTDKPRRPELPGRTFAEFSGDLAEWSQHVREHYQNALPSGDPWPDGRPVQSWPGRRDDVAGDVAAVMGKRAGETGMPGKRKTPRGVLRDVRCWCRLRHSGAGAWSAGRRGHCAVWGYATPWGALQGARGLHRLRRGSRRSASAPDITESFKAITGAYRARRKGRAQ